MANYAKVALTGRLTKEPKKSEYNGQTVISFSVAVYTTKKVDDKYVADFYNVSYWGKPAENAFTRLNKGTLVQVYGDLYQEPYTDRNNEKRLGMSVRANEVIWLKDSEGTAKPEPKASEPTGNDPF